MSNDLTPADPFGRLVPEDGVPRQTTQCKVLVFSHVANNQFKGKLVLTRDVTTCETSKTIKGGGNASFTLVPRLNYLNYIFPNDYVFIYFNTGGGEQWINTFFGFVDRVARTIQVGENGQSTTRFQVVCSDFTKAFMRTQLYFNPFIARREDIIGDFAGTANLGGVALRTKGVAMYGSPADLVMSLLQLTCGFGGQFMLPDSLKNSLNSELLEVNRKKRKEWARSRLTETVQKALVAGGGVTATEFEKTIKAQAAKILETTAEKPGQPTPKETQATIAKLLDNLGLPARIFNSQEYRSAKTIEAGASSDLPYHLLDLIDFRFVEWKAIDGHCTSASITWQEGSIWSIANGYSNEFCNEVFCDLRPMDPEPSKGSASSGSSSKEGKEVSQAGYSTADDSIKENEGGVRFAPCLVMREYPFSTIEGISPPPSVKVLKKELGLIYFGAIFAQDPNKPGRKTVRIPALHQDVILASDGKEMATKHLDVAVISSKDITMENVGRSDGDHFNLLEVYSDVTSSGKINYARFMTQEIQPVTNAVGVARHGLRVRKYTTRFGRWGIFQTRGGKVDQAANRRVLVRWALMLDHWYQHNIEYLNGTITTRAFPEIRVGFRLDIKDRRESYYVEGVNQSWSYPNPMTSTFTLSRGQRNDPYPVYVMPATKGFKGRRDHKGRLAEFFIQMEPEATARSSIMIADPDYLWTDKNYTDIPNQGIAKENWGSKKVGYLAANSLAPTHAKEKKEAEQAEALLQAKKKDPRYIDLTPEGVLKSLGLSQEPTTKTTGAGTKSGGGASND